MNGIKLLLFFTIYNEISKILNDIQGIEHCFLLIGKNNLDEVLISNYAILTNANCSDNSFEVPFYEIERIMQSPQNKNCMIIFCHSHPSGNRFASELDKEFMKVLKVPWAIFTVDDEKKLQITYYTDSQIVPIEVTVFTGNEIYLEK